MNYRNPTKLLGIILLLLISGTGLLPAQGNPQIGNLEPFIRNDSLLCNFEAMDIWQGEIRQTLLSGLPLLIEMIPRLLIPGDKPSPGTGSRYRLSYDIWEDRFSLQGADGRRVFSSLEELQQWWNPREDLPIAALSTLANPESLQVELSVRVVLLTGKQSEKLKDWILNSQETEEDLPSLNRDTGFKLNLNRVVSLFLNKSDMNETLKIDHRSPKFTLKDLPHR